MSNMPHYIVSGGSRGLGLQICKELLEMGCFVSTFARTSTLESKQLQEESMGFFAFAEVDICDQEALEQFIFDSEERFGPIRGLVNNAAIGQDDLLLHMSSQKIMNLVNVNILGTIALTKSALKRMLIGDGGKVIFISSICATKGFPGLSIYSGTKGFIDSFSRSLVVELKGSSISINSISPGFFASEMSSVLSENQLVRIQRNTPSGKLTETDDVVLALRYLLSSENSNGANIVIDGGSTS